MFLFPYSFKKRALIRKVPKFDQIKGLFRIENELHEFIKNFKLITLDEDLCSFAVNTSCYSNFNLRDLHLLKKQKKKKRSEKKALICDIILLCSSLPG